MSEPAAQHILADGAVEVEHAGASPIALVEVELQKLLWVEVGWELWCIDNAL
jgi:hypothetical protein